MQRPNIVLFLIDDMGWRDLACYGSTFYETPHLDRLAEQGLLFTNAYASCPVCSPTRASIMSGKYPARVGITSWIGDTLSGKLASVPFLHYLPLEEKSIASALREHGYQTWHVGKWHLGDKPFHPERHGFDVNIGGCHWGCPAQGYFHPWHIPAPGLDGGRDGEYLTDHLTDRAVDLIRSRRGNRPFFLNFWHYAVHTPLQAPEPLAAKYRQKARDMHLDQVEAIVKGEPLPCLGMEHLNVERRVLQSHPVYAAMMENMDASIGRVLQTLDEEGMSDNTLVVFTSDNGGLATAEGSPTCNAPLSEGKGWTSEGGTRVCQLVRWPGIVRPGRRCAANTTSTDFYPTLLEAAGAGLMPGQHVDGVSLMPLLRGAERLGRDAIFWHYPHYSPQGGRPAAAVVAGDWKLIENFEDGSLELYDLRNDIGERRNLAGVQPDRVQALSARLKAWQAEVEVRIPQANPSWEARRRPQVPNNAHE